MRYRVQTIGGLRGRAGRTAATSVGHAHAIYRLAVPNQPPSRSAELSPRSQPQVSAHGTGALIPPVDEQVRALLAACEPAGFSWSAVLGSAFCCCAAALVCMLAAASQPVCHPTSMCSQVVAMKLVTPALGTIELSKVGLGAQCSLGCQVCHAHPAQVASAACCPALFSL